MKWIEHVFGVTSAPGFTAYHGFYCGEMAWSDLDDDGDIDFVYSGVGGGFLGWFENTSAAAPIPTPTLPTAEMTGK